jgi:hypothetical protein
MWFDGETQKLREEKQLLDEQCTALKAELELYKEIAALSDKEGVGRFKLSRGSGFF